MFILYSNAITNRELFELSLDILTKIQNKIDTVLNNIYWLGHLVLILTILNLSRPGRETEEAPFLSQNRRD